MLGGLLEEEHAAQTAELLELRADASARAEVNFQRESNSIDALRAPATVGVALTQSLRSPARPGHQLGRREAWEKVAAVCGADSVKGVLEYWEDYAETRETLLASEEDRTSKIAELHEQNRRLTDEVPPSPSQLDCISLPTLHHPSISCRSLLTPSPPPTSLRRWPQQETSHGRLARPSMQSSTWRAQPLQS